LGGAYLCYEGTEKVYEAIFPNAAHAHEAHLPPLVASAKTLEQQKVASAIKTDFILSAEIMAITLAASPSGPFWQQAAVLAVVGIGITLLVYGGVALIVRADDAGVALATNRSSSFAGALLRGVGRAIVLGMPLLLKALAIVGTAAMIWVGGGIIVHGLETFGATSIAQTIHAVAESVAHVWERMASILEWLVTASGSGLVGLTVGALMIPMVSYVIAPAWKSLTKARR